LNRACQRLTEGQYLDLSYEKMDDLPLEAYFPMVQGKTASLLSACAELGAVCAQVSPKRREAFARFGNRLGMAFQAVDDWLGIWGDAALVGKSVESDLVSKKKTLPVLFGLQQKGKFADQWMNTVVIKPDDVPQFARLLIEEGAQDFTVREADRLTEEALSALKEASSRESDASMALLELANALLRRDK
jgi:geranylgeranyl diphosphate synthase type I